MTWMDEWKIEDKIILISNFEVTTSISQKAKGYESEQI